MRRPFPSDLSCPVWVPGCERAGLAWQGVHGGGYGPRASAKGPEAPPVDSPRDDEMRLLNDVFSCDVGAKAASRKWGRT